MDHKDSQFMGCDNNALYIGEYNPRTVAEQKKSTNLGLAATAQFTSQNQESSEYPGVNYC